ncbi:hypothetical protein CcaverHIS002_0304170 [Cutaneotrichosporon cavernicola]|uniref:glutathione transferase n=1 Tax=Cutaneotrichosporon cavernicola TaxID=279322 RepID=A0AA48I629_9TREE|nr:uncharacterized protein CcaverHIS019_0304140 [Cutaneotrichosporon cavernicola]BEI82549.1 hypothetical protein CcaverHIS002_0304170 [Cutaneotrichosporon cavernicola]BEI90344.1 hypothetical protein CcaverHIS019_0304140 [Cutaneotrichosporon cavernicola]BEI98120.1 hypothetical protein CcaverHIS631_0304190 [Cutaneotrichosporon cavernicola]BEJ05897.1 hypothetical protein CcaverHIS641_0304190 [Cutaneotrichosporon cavernicola]
MSYTLHGSILSTCTARVVASGATIGADIKLENHDFHAIHEAAWAKNQPFNQMPYLVDNTTSFEIFESRAICKYIANKAGSDLLPKQSDAEAYGRFEQGCSIEQSNFDPAASGLAFQLVFAKMFGLETDVKLVEKLKGDLTKKLQGYERLLSKQKFVGGDKLTLADIFHLPYGSIVAQLGVVPSLTDGSLPHVKAWWDTISSLPAWKEYEQQKAAAMAAMGAAK